MKHKIYTKDWYFNAGIIGFIMTLYGKTNLEDCQDITFGDNYIEFDDAILEGFEEKFIHKAFLNTFKIVSFTSKLENILKECAKSNKKSVPKEIGNAKQLKSLLDALEIKIENLEQITTTVALLKSWTVDKIYDELLNKKNAKNYIKDFIEKKLIGICSYDNLNKFIDKIKNTDYSKNIKNNDFCLFCQQRKSEFNFNNAISNIVGFNSDNSNWVWGYKDTKLKICPVCALIYNCAFIAFANVTKMINSKYINYMYFLNYNSSIKKLYSEIKKFKINIEENKENNNTIYLMVKQILSIIQKEQVESIHNNINFIEVIENPILAGQSTKGYNVYNYNIDKELAQFLNQYIGAEEMPKGYYKLQKSYFSIDEELITSSILRKLSYSDINKYLSIHISDSIKGKKFNPYKISNFIFDYINSSKGGTMAENKKIINKAFWNGAALKTAIKVKNKENQINGIIYGFLNDLKISDREKFLDKYIRLMMAYEMPLKFGENEMSDKDSFLQFGYSFINGLLYNHKEKEAE